MFYSNGSTKQRFLKLMWIWPASSLICGNEMPTRCNRWFLLQILLLAQHVSGTTMPIIRSSTVLYRWLLPVVFDALVFKLSIWCEAGLQTASHHIDNLKTKAPSTIGSNHLYNTVEFLMMGIVVPETCWASNKICNKNHLLHLVGISFPHINDDAGQIHINFRKRCLVDPLVGILIPHISIF